LPSAPAARPAGSTSLFSSEAPLRAPEADPKTREEKRFARYDKNKDGKVEPDEYLVARRKNFEKLDTDHNSALSFQEYAVKGIEKFNAADKERNGWLSAAEFTATAPPPPKHKACSCRAEPQIAAADDNND
jgi:hypothetical protein